MLKPTFQTIKSRYINVSGFLILNTKQVIHGLMEQKTTSKFGWLFYIISHGGAAGN